MVHADYVRFGADCKICFWQTENTKFVLNTPHEEFAGIELSCGIYAIGTYSAGSVRMYNDRRSGRHVGPGFVICTNYS